MELCIRAGRLGEQRRKGTTHPARKSLGVAAVTFAPCPPAQLSHRNEGEAGEDCHNDVDHELASASTGVRSPRAAADVMRTVPPGSLRAGNCPLAIQRSIVRRLTRCIAATSSIVNALSA